jgi:hypothetical protein
MDEVDEDGDGVSGFGGGSVGDDDNRGSIISDVTTCKLPELDKSFDFESEANKEENHEEVGFLTTDSKNLVNIRIILKITSVEVFVQIIFYMLRT